MNDMNALVEIGLQEVSRQTHIEVKTLEYMIDKEFDKLGRINALGFLKIINREYNLDLSEWQAEFEAYWDAKKIGAEGSKPDGMFLVNTPSKPMSKRPFIIILLLALGGAAWYFNAWEHAKSYIDEQAKNDNVEKNSSYTTPLIVEEVEETLASMPIMELPDESNASSVVLDVPLIEENEALPMVSEENNSSISSIKTKEIEQEVVLEAKKKIEKELTPKTLMVDEGIVLPNIKIWVGVIYLDTKKRASFLSDGPIILDLTKEQIITTGHGNFSLRVGDKEYDFTEELPKRFHWVDGEMKEINSKEYMALNGGSLGKTLCL